MSRRIRLLLSLLVVSFALSAAACADATGPAKEQCDYQGSNTKCLAADYQGSNT